MSEQTEIATALADVASDLFIVQYMQEILRKQLEHLDRALATAKEF